MSTNIRIENAIDPKKPKAPDGIISIYVNGKFVPLPPKGQAKVVNERVPDILVHSEYLEDQEST